MPPEDRFEHHGVVVETREQWTARQAAETAARIRAEEDARRHAAVAAAKAAKAASVAADAAKAASAAKAADAAKAVDAAKAADAMPPAEVRPTATSAFWRTMLFSVTGLVVATCAGVLLSRMFGTSAASSESEIVFDAVKVTPRAPAGPAILGQMMVGTGRAGRSLADAPTIDPSSGGWWCICYKSNGGADHTACRRQYSECESLREMVQATGSSTIVQGSAHPGSCQSVSGSYPWERLGHREAWRPSAYSDATGGATSQERDRRRATQAPGVCAL